jgi:hypothetical protein
MRIGRCFVLLAPVLTVGVGTLTGCPSRDVSAVDPSQAKEEQKEIPVNLNRDIDILWVIDNSGSMRQEQESLARNFPEFIDVLNTIEGGLPDIHMGIISSNVGTGDDGLESNCEDDGDNGILQVGTCPALTGGVRFIEDIAIDDDGTNRQKNYSGDLADQFSCMAQLGIGGCGFEQHLESMRRALENTDENAGFLREDAFLAVIFIQDEDDCSASNTALFGGSRDDTRDSEFGEYSSFRCFEYGTACDPDAERTLGPRDNCVPDDESDYIEQVSTYIDFLKGVKDDPDQLIVAAITGPTGPVTVVEDADPDKNDQLWVPPACLVCDGGGATCDARLRSDGDAIVAAAPAVRMNAFLGGFPGAATLQDICAYDPAINDVDLSGALNEIADLVVREIGNPCIEGILADSDPNAGGLQVECRVSDVSNLNKDDEEEFPIPPCDDSSEIPCFRLVEDNNCSATPTGLALDINRGDPPQDAPPNTTVVARCLVE